MFPKWLLHMVRRGSLCNHFCFWNIELNSSIFLHATLHIQNDILASKSRWCLYRQLGATSKTSYQNRNSHLKEKPCHDHIIVFILSYTSMINLATLTWHAHGRYFVFITIYYDIWQPNKPTLGICRDWVLDKVNHFARLILPKQHNSVTIQNSVLKQVYIFAWHIHWQFTNLVQIRIFSIKISQVPVMESFHRYISFHSFYTTFSLYSTINIPLGGISSKRSGWDYGGFNLCV